MLDGMLISTSMAATDTDDFDRRYQSHLKHLKMQGTQPKTIDACARGIRRMGEYFDHQIDSLSEGQVTGYFSALIQSHSWSAVKLDLYGYKFYATHVLRRPWTLTIQFLEVIEQALHQQPERARQFIGSVFDQPRNTHGDVADALRDDDSELAERAADLVRLRGTRTHKLLSDPLQGEDRLLLDVLDDDFILHLSQRRFAMFAIDSSSLVAPAP